MTQVSIQKQLKWLAIAPAIILLVIVSIIEFVYTNKYAEDELKRQGDVLAEQFARSAEYYIETGNSHELNRLGDYLIRSEIIETLILNDPEGNEILNINAPVQIDNNWSNYISIFSKYKSLVKTTSIYATNIDIYDYDESDTSAKRLLGNLMIILNSRTLTKHRNTIILSLFIISLISVAIVTVLGTGLANSVSKPISVITGNIDQIRKGSLTTTNLVFKTKELSILQDGINEMVASLRDYQTTMQYKVDTSVRQYKLSEERVKKLSDLNVEGIVIVNENIIEDTNEALLDLLGFDDRKLLIGKDINTIIDPKIHILIIRQIITNEYTAVDTITKRSDGTFIPIEINARAFQYDSNVKSYALCVRDISTRKQVEDSLERAGQAKSQFLANMSHEIRTPINGILGFATSLKKTSLNESQQVFTDYILHSVNLLRRLVDDILEFSKFEKGNISIENENVDLEILVADTISRCSKSNPTHSLIIEYEMIEPINTHVYVDPYRLNQVLTNLLENAIKFTAEGRIKLSISVLQKNTELLEYHFMVEDTGIGIHNDKIKSIFNVFSQADSSINRKYGGTGLGLSISKKIIEAMHGHIGVESKVGKGSNFWFTIPLNIALSNDKKREKEILVTRPNLAGYNILVADDNIINLQYLRFSLKELGANVTDVDNGFSAYQLIKDNPYDLVMADIEMPGMSGVELLQQIKQLNAPKLPPVIAVTAHVYGDIISKINEAGFVGMLSKPYNEEDLWIALNKGLSIPQAGNTGKDYDHKENILPASLVDSFKSQLKEKRIELSNAIDNHDNESIRKIAHLLKGSAGIFQQQNVVKHCSLVLDSINNPDDMDFNELIPGLLEAIDDALDT